MSYQIDSLLERGYEQLKAIKVSQKANIVPPLIKALNKKTYIENIIDFCNSIKRDPNDVMNFINGEMDVKSSLCDSGLKINKLYRDVRPVKSALSEYIKKYVLCSACKSKNTIIETHDRQKYLVCENCKCEVCL